MELLFADMLETCKCITTHAQKACPMIFWGCGYMLSDGLRVYKDLPWQKLTDQSNFPNTILLIMIMLYRYRL